MAKEIVTISNLGGGLNTFANPRQIEDSQLVVADNVDTSVEGQSGVVGGFSDYTNVSSGSVIKDAPVKEGGYGLLIALLAALYPIISYIKARNEDS